MRCPSSTIGRPYHVRSTKMRQFIGPIVFLAVAQTWLFMMASSVWHRPWHLAWLMPWVLVFIAMEKLRPAWWVRFWRRTSDRERTRWLRARRLGFKRFVLLWGLAYFGRTMALAFTGLIYLVCCLTHRQLMNPVGVVTMLQPVIWALYPLAGILFGASMWVVNEWRYETEPPAGAAPVKPGPAQP